jgi:hypothetical protein
VCGSSSKSKKEKKPPARLPPLICVWHCGRKREGGESVSGARARVSWIHPRLVRPHKWKTGHLSLSLSLSLSSPIVFHSFRLASSSADPGAGAAEPGGSLLLVDFGNQAGSWSQSKFPAAVGSSAILMVLLFLTSQRVGGDAWLVAVLLYALNREDAGILRRRLGVIAP